MDAAAVGGAQKEDREGRIDQQDIFYRVVFFLAAITCCLCSSVLGADDASLRPRRQRSMKMSTTLCTVKGESVLGALTATVLLGLFGLPTSALDTPPQSCDNGGKDTKNNQDDHERTTHRSDIRLDGVFLVNITCPRTLDRPREERRNHG
jgi:hypothetical protein